MNLLTKLKDMAVKKVATKKTVAKKELEHVEETKLETQELCVSCEGKGTVREGTKICADCNGECFK